MSPVTAKPKTSRPLQTVDVLLPSFQTHMKRLKTRILGSTVHRPPAPFKFETSWTHCGQAFSTFIVPRLFPADSQPACDPLPGRHQNVVCGGEQLVHLGNGHRSHKGTRDRGLEQPMPRVKNRGSNSLAPWNLFRKEVPSSHCLD